MRSLINFLSVLLALLLVGCPPVLRGDDDDVTDDDDAADDDTPPEPVGACFGWGYYFGECAGPCRTDLTANANGDLQLVQQDWDGTLYYEATTSLSGDGLGELLSTLSQIEPEALEETYGCPDCADGGGEYVSWVDESGQELRSDYEFGNPPVVLQNLDLVYDAIVAELFACSFEFWVVAFPDCEPI